MFLRSRSRISLPDCTSLQTEVVTVYGMTRGLFTLLGAAAAGLLVWSATQFDQTTTGGYWKAEGIVAGAGGALALAQLVGGWRKRGRPRLVLAVLLLGFAPALIAAGWIIIDGQPQPNWLRQHVSSWSGDIGIRGLVDELRAYISALAFGLGLLLGFSFDSSGLQTAPLANRPPVATAAVGGDEEPRPVEESPTVEETRAA